MLFITVRRDRVVNMARHSQDLSCHDNREMKMHDAFAHINQFLGTA